MNIMIIFNNAASDLDLHWGFIDFNGSSQQLLIVLRIISEETIIAREFNVVREIDDFSCKKDKNKK